MAANNLGLEEERGREYKRLMAPLSSEPINGQTPREMAAAAVKRSDQEASARKLELRKSIAGSIKTILTTCKGTSLIDDIADPYMVYVDVFPTAKPQGETGYRYGDPEIKYWILEIGEDEKYVLPEVAYNGIVLRPDGKVHRIKYSPSDQNSGAPMSLEFGLISETTKDGKRFELVPGVIESKQEGIGIQNKGPHTAYVWEGKLGGKEVSLTSGSILISTEEETLEKIDGILRLETGPRP